MKWVKTGFNTWQLDDVIVYLAQLPCPAWFATKNGKQRKFTDKEEMISWIKER